MGAFQDGAGTHLGCAFPRSDRLPQVDGGSRSVELARSEILPQVDGDAGGAIALLELDVHGVTIYSDFLAVSVYDVARRLRDPVDENARSVEIPKSIGDSSLVIATWVLSSQCGIIWRCSERPRNIGRLICCVPECTDCNARG